MASTSPPYGVTADVIIVGAGLSGLTAAQLIQQAGHACIILEAPNRIGGKRLVYTLVQTDPA